MPERFKAPIIVRTIFPHLTADLWIWFLLSDKLLMCTERLNGVELLLHTRFSPISQHELRTTVALHLCSKWKVKPHDENICLELSWRMLC